MCLFAEQIQRKYYNYLKKNNVQICTDVYERMDLIRQVIESIKKLQLMENLTEKEFGAKKAVLMRKLPIKNPQNLKDKD